MDRVHDSRASRGRGQNIRLNYGILHYLATQINVSRRSVAAIHPPLPVFVVRRAGCARCDRLASARCWDLTRPGKPFWNIPLDTTDTELRRNLPVPPCEQGLGALLGLQTEVGCLEEVDDKVVQSRETVPIMLLHPVWRFG